MTGKTDPEAIPRRTGARRGAPLVAAALALVVAVAAVTIVWVWPRAAEATSPRPSLSSAAPASSAPDDPPVPVLAAAVIAALPEARYDAVIGGLPAFPDDPAAKARVFHAAADLPLFAQPGGQPVARLAARDFLDEPSPVVVVQTRGSWALVLTPARHVLPSKATPDAPAAAQTAAWAPLAALTDAAIPTDRVVISATAQTVSIVKADGTVAASFPAGVGTADTPTPTGVTGYLEARYVDPSQGTGEHPIQLTSLHSVAADEPYGGSDGGLIGVHYADQRTGAVSHGCVRIGADAVAAINALPLGTLVRIK